MTTSSKSAAATASPRPRRAPARTGGEGKGEGARALRESDIERYLVRRVRECFGKAALCRKVTWQGRRSAPDRVVMLPYIFGTMRSQVNTAWVELKKPGEKPTPAQRAEHLRMGRAGQCVWVLSSKEDVDYFVRTIGGEE